MDRHLQLVVDELSKAKIKLHEPYQVDGVKWMLQREMSGKKAGLLCDEPGLGKTIQTIATMIGNEVEHTLIVVPISVIGQWKDTVQLLKPEWSVLVPGLPPSLLGKVRRVATGASGVARILPNEYLLSDSTHTRL